MRKEDKNRWERRAPLSPSHVKQLTSSGIKVLVEASDKRIFPDVAYEKVSPFLGLDLGLLHQLGLLMTFSLSFSLSLALSCLLYPLLAIQAGAKVVSDLSEADLILGVKEVPIAQLIPNKSYLFFSHTHKGQPYNMPMLDSVLDKVLPLLSPFSTSP